MSGPDPQAPVYDFRVKYPPQLPPTFQDSGGVIHPTSWSQHAKYHVARYDQDSTGFDVAVENNNTAHWPYHLGHPSDYPGVNPLIRKWGLQVMDAAGFITHEHEAGDSYADPIGRMARTRNPHDSEEEQLHPVLRRDLFASVTDDDYELLRPALILASAILDDPTTLHFFHAVSDSYHRSWIYDQRMGMCNIVTIPATLSQAELTAANKKIMDMRLWTHFAVGDHHYFDENIGYGLTETYPPPSHIPPFQDTVFRTRVVLSPQWIATLRALEAYTFSRGTEYQEMAERILDLAGVPKNRRPERFHVVSATMRVNLKLAATILHEFSHAFVRAYVEGDQVNYREPWIAGNRSNEIGCAHENFTYGGWLHANTLYRPPMTLSECHAQTIASPFGFHFIDPWDASAADTSYGETTLSQPQTQPPDYPVPQR